MVIPNDSPLSHKSFQDQLLASQSSYAQTASSRPKTSKSNRSNLSSPREGSQDSFKLDSSFLYKFIVSRVPPGLTLYVFADTNYSLSLLQLPHSYKVV